MFHDGVNRHKHGVNCDGVQRHIVNVIFPSPLVVIRLYEVRSNVSKSITRLFLLFWKYIMLMPFLKKKYKLFNCEIFFRDLQDDKLLICGKRKRWAETCQVLQTLYQWTKKAAANRSYQTLPYKRTESGIKIMFCKFWHRPSYKVQCVLLIYFHNLSEIFIHLYGLYRNLFVLSKIYINLEYQLKTYLNEDRQSPCANFGNSRPAFRHRFAPFSNRKCPYIDIFDQVKWEQCVGGLIFILLNDQKKFLDFLWWQP